MVPKLQLVMLQSLRAIASITTDLYVVVPIIATCVLLFRLLRTCMLPFRLLPLAYPVSFIAHLLLPFRPLLTTVSSNSSIHLLLTIFQLCCDLTWKRRFLSHDPFPITRFLCLISPLLCALICEVSKTKSCIFEGVFGHFSAYRVSISV